MLKRILGFLTGFIVCLAMVYFIFCTRTLHTVILTTGDYLNIHLPEDYVMADYVRPLLVDSVPGAMTFEYKDYTVTVFEVMGDLTHGYQQNPNRTLAQSAVWTMIKALDMQSYSEMYEIARDNALEFGAMYDYLYPDPEPIELSEIHWRYIFYTNYGYLDPRLDEFFQGQVLDLYERNGTIYGVVIEHNNIDEAVSVLDTVMEKTIAESNTTGMWSDVINAMLNCDEDAVDEYNDCAKSAKLIRDDMISALDDFEKNMFFSKLCFLLTRDSYYISMDEVFNDYYTDLSSVMEDYTESENTEQ